MKRMVLALVLVGCGAQPTKSEPPTPTEKVRPLDAPTPDAPIAIADPPLEEKATPPSDHVPIGDLEVATPPKRKQTQADLAAGLTNEGIELMKLGSFEAASAKFRDAVARMPEPKYFFNLCVSLYEQGLFIDALTACDAVKDTTPRLQEKTVNMMQRILDAAGRQGIKVK